MARSVLVATLTALIAASSAFSQPAPAASATPAPAPKDRDSKPAADSERPRKDRDGGPAKGPHGPGERPQMPPMDDPMFQKFRQKLEQMSPEERQKFKENLKRWKDMGEDERRNWQKRAMEERARLARNVDDALAKLGLTLDADQREVFALRYMQERRKLEMGLCKEMDEKRKAGVEQILQKLKTEFSAPLKTEAPTPSPSATPRQ